MSSFSVSLWLRYKGWNTSWAQMVMLVHDTHTHTQAAVTWRILVQPGSQVCEAPVKEYFPDARAENPGFGRLRQCGSFGPAPDSGSIDTHLRFLCTPSHTPHTLSYIHKSAFFTSLSFCTLDHLPSCAYLCTSPSDLILCNVTLLDLWC